MKEVYSEFNVDKICNNNNKRLKCYCKKISFKGNLFLKIDSLIWMIFFFMFCRGYGWNSGKINLFWFYCNL